MTGNPVAARRFGGQRIAPPSFSTELKLGGDCGRFCGIASGDTIVQNDGEAILLTAIEEAFMNRIRSERRLERHPPANNLCGPLVADFASAILDDREPTVTGEEGRTTNAVMERAYNDSR